MGPRALLRSLRSLLFEPTTFFERHRSRLSGSIGLGVAFGLSVVLVAILAGGFWFLSVQLTGTTTIDNPDRPPEGFCENQPPMPHEVDSGCDEPATVEVETGTLLWRVATDVLVTVFFGLLIGWVILGVLLHIGAVLSGGNGSVRNALAVTAFALVPSVVVALVAVTIIVGWATATDLSSGSAYVLEEQFRQLGTGFTGIALPVVRFVGLAWEVVVWTAGLAVAYDIEHGEAVFPALVVGGLLAVLSLV